MLYAIAIVATLLSGGGLFMLSLLICVCQLADDVSDKLGD